MFTHFIDITGDLTLTQAHDGALLLVKPSNNCTLTFADCGPIFVGVKKVSELAHLVTLTGPGGIDALPSVALTVPYDYVAIQGDGTKLWTVGEHRNYWFRSGRTVTRVNGDGTPRDSYSVKVEDGGWEIRVDLRGVGQVPAGDMAIYFPPWNQLGAGYRHWRTRLRLIDPSPQWKRLYVFPFQGYTINGRDHTQPLVMTSAWDCLEVYTDGQQGFANRMPAP